EVKRNEYRFAPSANPSPVLAGAIMGVFYILGGFFTFAPYFFFDIEVAIPMAIVLTVGALFFVGVLKAKLTGTNVWRSGVEMLVISSMAAGIGFGLGRFVPMIFHMNPVF
ncbi:MAG: VIT1/CCC1 transporter family protein, partial [Methylococcaceae bacterium]